MEGQRYYHVALKYTAIVLAAGLGLLVGSYHKKSVEKRDIAKLGAQQTNQIQIADLNNNGIPERFYTIDNRIALIELDGKPVTELLKR